MEKLTPRALAAQSARWKHFLRGFHRGQALSLSARERSSAAKRAALRVAGLPAFKAAQTVGLFVSMPGEIDTGPLFDLCSRAGKTAAVPVVFPGEFRMEYSLLTGRVRWTRNVYGIPEPVEDDRRLIDPRNLELIVLPGRAFTPAGERLGMGGGYFDRFSARCPEIPSVALAFDSQVVPRLPIDRHDAPVDVVVTPSRVYRAR